MNQNSRIQTYSSSGKPSSTIIGIIICQYGSYDYVNGVMVRLAEIETTDIDRPIVTARVKVWPEEESIV